MAKVTKIRDSGTLAERRHDAFLLAMLLALVMNVTFFAAQALIPKLSHLLQMLGAEPAVRQEEDTAYPFVLVDASLLSEDIDPDIPHHAESDISREARQEEAVPDLPEDKPFIEEGIEELLTLPDGNPGPASAQQQATGETADEISPDQEDVASENMEDSDAVAEETPETAQPDEPVDIPDIPEPLSEPAPAEESPPADPMPEAPPPADPLPESIWETPPDPVEPAPPPEPIEPDLPDPQPIAETPDPEPEMEPLPDPEPELIELAALPVSPEGFFDPQTRLLEEMARRDPYRQPPPQQMERPVEHQPPQPASRQQPAREQTGERPRSRQGRPQPTFKKIGNAGSAPGGSPRQRNTGTRVNVLDSDPNMRILKSRYGEYMAKVARQLQDSLNRTMVLNPGYYSRGQAKIRFSIAADGSLAYSDTEYPIDGSNDIVRRVSEQTVREAAPFDPPTEEMLRDPVFQRMSVTVFLY